MSVTGPLERAAYVLLRIGNRRFALPSRHIVELAPPVRLHDFPHASKFVAGVIVRRGRIVPVYDVSPLLTGRESSLHRFYLVANVGLGNEHEASAFPVTGECELASGDVLPREESDPAYFTGKLGFEGEAVDVLNLESLVAAGAEFAQSAEARS
ncbi:MAG: chemotaxis protein CheW [Candidatus Acidiferrales bacterium]